MRFNAHGGRVTALALNLVLALLLISARTRAQEAGQIETILEAEIAGRIAPGQDHAFEARLTDEAGEPVPDQVVELYLNDNLEGTGVTEASGRVRIRLKSALQPGGYALRFHYAGSRLFARTTDLRVIEVAPVELTIAATPPLAGLQFTLNGTRFETGADGVARILVDRAGEYQLIVLSYQSPDPDQQATFRRWDPEDFEPERTLHIQSATNLAVGHDLRQLVRFGFIDPVSGPVDPARITSLTVRASNGTNFTFDGGEPQWLMANRVVRRLTGLEAVDLTYSIQNVMIDGANVVNRGQQSFAVLPAETWQIELLLFSARFTTRDLLFGFPLGSGIRLTYPDGSEREFAFDGERQLVVGSLARGAYLARIVGAPGIVIPTPIALSRNQEVRLLAISYPTLAVFLLLPVLVAVQLILIGRPGLFPAALGRLSARPMFRRTGKER